MYQKRHMDTLLKKYLDNFPAILVEGAKAVGKTSTCEELARTSYYLDDEDQFQIIANSPESILGVTPPVLIDEWQKFPPIWEKARRMVDHGMPTGTLLLTGSSPLLHSQLHSGAGRLVTVKMRPFTIEERQMSEHFISVSKLMKNPEVKLSGNSEWTQPDYLDEILKSGFPGIREQNDLVRKGLLKGYVENIVHREFRENGYDIRKPEMLHQWLASYAAAISTMTSFQTILEASSKGESDSPAPNTVSVYREMLLAIGVIEEVPSWIDFGKIFPALTKSSKHFILDPALLAPLLGVTKEKLMKGDVPRPIGKINKTFVGQLFEAFVYQSLATYAEINQLRLSHLRLQQGNREIDFILEDAEKNLLLAIEVKSASAVRDDDVKHLNWFEKIAGNEFKVIRLVVYMGKFAYTRKDGVHVIPSSMLGI